MNNLESKLCEVCLKKSEIVLFRKYVNDKLVISREPHYSCKDHTVSVIDNYPDKTISFEIRYLEDEYK